MIELEFILGGSIDDGGKLFVNGAEEMQIYRQVSRSAQMFLIVQRDERTISKTWLGRFETWFIGLFIQHSLH